MTIRNMEKILMWALGLVTGYMIAIFKPAKVEPNLKFLFGLIAIFIVLGVLMAVTHYYEIKAAYMAAAQQAGPSCFSF